MSSRSVSISIVADFLQGFVHTIAGGSAAHQPASGPAPTNVGQVPQASVTVILVMQTYLATVGVEFDGFL
jgi:hypothetical protein